MFPVLFTIGNFPVSSYGLFLALGIFFGAFSVWRLARSFDFDAERVLDLIFLTVGIGFVFSRAVFVLLNTEIFDNLTKVFFVNRYPGLSFWGGLIGGFLALVWFSKRHKITFLQSADLAIVGFFIAAFFAEVGCLLGGCGIGLQTTSYISVDQAGAIGKRIPIQIYEALFFLIVFIRFWKSILRFHIQGSFLAKGLILIGLSKIISGFFKEPGQSFDASGIKFYPDFLLAITVTIAGFYYHYKIYRRTPFEDIKVFFRLLTSRQMQKNLAVKITRGWYNARADLTIGAGRGFKRILKMLNVRSNPEKFK